MSAPRIRRLVVVLWDCASWLVATLIVVGARYDFVLPDAFWSRVAVYCFGACLLQVVIGTAVMLYRGRYRIASFDESLGLALTVLLVGGLLAVTVAGLSKVISFPVATAALTPPVTLLLMAAGRWGFRAWRDRLAPQSNLEKVLIYGAGEAGYQLLQLISRDRTAPYQVVGFIDDAVSKRRLRLNGIPVLGTRSDLVAIAARRDVSAVILAIADAKSPLVREVTQLVEGAGMRLMVLRPLTELIDGRVRLSDLREVDIDDLLGRHRVDTDLGEVAGYLTDRVVLVTGAGGSIGSELAKQVHRFGPKELVLLDRDESALHSVQLSIYGQGMLDTPDIVLCDIRDREALDAVFATHRPDVVFHAAALKHLPMLEQYPSEGWKTNVQGSLNVLQAADRYQCSRFVNVSTDKAANPTSVLGRTKRLAERLTAWQSTRSSCGTYLSVRFGNVLGSRGSVLHTFTSQISSGGPVTITHPDITRYFMTVSEACELVIQAAAIGDDGEVLVLDMGEPMRIVDVARQLISRSGQTIDIVFTGLRPGEKLHEVLMAEDESGTYKHHAQICHVPVPALDPESLRFHLEVSTADNIRPLRAAGGRNG